MMHARPANYRFLVQCNPRPPDIPPFCQAGFFFNEHAHLRQQSDGPFYLITAVNQSTQQAEARCAFFLFSAHALSPLAAPFGSIEYAEILSVTVLDAFLKVLIDTVRGLSITRLRLVNYPRCYAPRQTDQLLLVLAQHGVKVVEVHTNSFLAISHEPFEKCVVPAERRRLRKCREAGFIWAHWQSANLGEVIQFIQHTRQQQGYSLPVSPEQLLDLLQAFPGQFAVFTVHDGPHLAALAITVRVREDILYTFLPASHPAYRSFSPMVMLIDGMYAYCQQQGIQLLDLGVSLDTNRQPKPGLLRFKRNLGAWESPKFVFEKVL